MYSGTVVVMQNKLSSGPGIEGQPRNPVPAKLTPEKETILFLSHLPALPVGISLLGFLPCCTQLENDVRGKERKGP